MPGSHGSLTKAGKVRMYQTTKREKTGVNSRKKKIPRVRYREKYIKLFIDEEYNGQPDGEGARREKIRKEREARNKKQRSL